MKVLFHLLDAGTGGGQLVAARVAARLVDRGDDVGVAVPGPGPALESFEALGAQVAFVDAGTLRRPLSGRSLARILEPYDLLYSHTEIPGVILGAFAAKSTRRPHVVHQHNAPYFSPSRPVQLAQKALFRAVIGPARFIAVAEHVRVGLEAAGVRGNRVEVVPNGVPSFEAPAPRASDVVTVGMLARLDPRKKVDVFLEAAARAEPATPVRYVVGGVSGPFAEYESAVREQAAAVGIEIVHTERGTEFLCGLDIVVIPSSYEGAPLVLLEAMALGRAVIASDIPGMREVIEPDHAGILVPPGDPGALATAIETLVDDADRQEDLGERARAVAGARYGLSAMLERTLVILEESAGG